MLCSNDYLMFFKTVWDLYAYIYIYKSIKNINKKYFKTINFMQIKYYIETILIHNNNKCIVKI